VRLLVVVLPMLVVAAMLMFLVLRRPATPISPAGEHRCRAVTAKASSIG
jgi:hypothetical protein